MHIVLSGIDIIRIEGENSSRYQMSMKKKVCVGRAMAVLVDVVLVALMHVCCRCGRVFFGKLLVLLELLKAGVRLFR